MESDIIKISHLNKSFSEVKAVNDLSFRVKKGELFAFLGVNGAGKSTTISILCGLQKKDSGTVQVNGIETDKAGAQTKRMLGVVFQDSVLDKPLTVIEHSGKGDICTVTFTQNKNLQGGEYLLSFGCTGYKNGDFTVFHWQPVYGFRFSDGH